MTTLTVRRARPADSERIRELNELAMSETPEWVPDAPDADLRDVQTHYVDAGGEFLVGVREGRILATAAYNAGAYRVSQWIDEDTRDLASDIWVETMPYHETRQYVRNVMAYTVIYGYRRGEPPGHLLTERELACMCLDDVP